MTKVERKVVEPKFEPVVVTIDNQVDLDYFTTMLANSRPSDFPGVDVHGLYEEFMAVGGSYEDCTITKGD